MAEAIYLLPLGFVDGLNICVLSLVALLISLMFSFNLGRTRVLLMGAAFIASIYMTYFLVGLGFLTVFFGFPTAPHVLARVSAAIMILIGTANIVNYISPNLVPVYNVSTYLGRGAVQLIKKAAIPALIGAGALTGLHSFPCACTGGIYTLFLSTLSKQNGWEIFYLLLYNTFFIVPAITILVTCTNKHVALRMRRLLHEKHASAKLWLGAIMVAVAVIILWEALTTH
ncbi:MAG: hypothetical protein QXR26_07090 [Candidatus Caldarchaeum sp.]